jgi:hypothetical protein
MRRLLVVTMAAVLLLGACGGNDKKSSNASASKGSTSTTAIGADSSTTAAPSGGSGGTGAGSATTKKSGGSSSGSGGSPTPGPQPSTAAGQKATAPGTYKNTVTGTRTIGSAQTVNATSTLKVDALQGTDQHSVTTSSDGGSSEQVLRYLADGVYLVSLKTTTSGITKEFKLDPPGLSFPQPATVGKTWSWTATSTDGKSTVKSDFKVARNEAVMVGTENVPAVVIEATVTLTGDITATSHRTIWVSEAYRMIVRSDDKTQGSYSGFNFSSDTSEKLQSTKPS